MPTGYVDEPIEVVTGKGFVDEPYVDEPLQPREVTPLAPAEEKQFQAWARTNKIADVDAPQSFYDYRGYWKDVASKGADQRKAYDDGPHFPDTYKQHGHPTFSVESQYSTGPNDGGRWDGETYVPQGQVPRLPVVPIVPTLAGPVPPSQPPVTLGGGLNMKTGQPAPPLPEHIPLLDAPFEGVPQLARGATALGRAAVDSVLHQTPPRAPIDPAAPVTLGGGRNMKTGEPLPTPAPMADETLAAGSDVLEGTFKVLTPLLIAAGFANPIGLMKSLVAAYGASKATEFVSKEAGLNDEQTRLLSNVAGAIGASVGPGAVREGFHDAAAWGRARSAAREARRSWPIDVKTGERVDPGTGEVIDTARVRNPIAEIVGASPEPPPIDVALKKITDPNVSLEQIADEILTPPVPPIVIEPTRLEPSQPVSPPLEVAPPAPLGHVDEPLTPDEQTKISEPLAPAVEKPAIKANTYKFSSTQVNLSKDISEKMAAVGAKIPDADLAGDGRETEHHVTVKYGLHTNDVEEVRKLLADEPPITVTLGKTSTFPPSEHSDGAATIKVDVDSPDLHRLNKKISDALEHTDSFPDYKPHATIAYVKESAAKKYVSDAALEGQQTKIDTIRFSAKDGSQVDVKLAGAQTPAVASTTATLHERRELGRLATELEEMPFTKRSFIEAGAGKGGDLEVIPGAAGAPVYNDILQAAPGTAAYTRADVARAIRKYLATGKITNPVRGALEVARARMAGTKNLSGRTLAPSAFDIDAGNEPGKIYVKRVKGLAPSLSPVQRDAADLVESQPEEMIAKYRAAFPDTISADKAKELFPGYETPDARTVNEVAIHPAAVALAQAVYDQAVAEPLAEGRAPTVAFSGGGTGSGKTTGLEQILALMGPVHATYDSTLSDAVWAMRNIDRALEHGKGVTVVFTYRPIEAAFRGTLSRAMETGRPVPIAAHIATHAGALKTIREVKARYGEDVEIIILDNSGAKREAQQIDLQDLPDPDYTDPSVRQALHDIVDEELAAGTISEAVARSARGQSKSRRPDSGSLSPQDRSEVTRRGGGGAASNVGAFDESQPARSAPIPKPDDRRLFPGTAIDTASTAQPVQFPELVELAKRLQGVPKVVKAFRTPGKLGEFSERGIKLTSELFKPGNEYQLAATLAHEIGHLVDFLPHNTLKRGNLLGRLFSLKSFLKHTFTAIDGTTIKNKDIRTELMALSDKWRPWDPAKASPGFKQYRHSGKELYADALSVLLNNPGLLERAAPIFYKEFFAELDRKPEVKAAYFDLQEVLAGTPAELVARRRIGVRRMFEEGDVTALELEKRRQAELAERNKNLWFRLKTEHIDKNYRVIDRVHELEQRGVRLAPDEDPRYFLEERNYLGSLLKAFTERHFKPVFTTIGDADIHWNAFNEALLYERILAGDRSEVANPRGLSPAVAREMYDSLQRELGPEKVRVITKAMTDFRAAVKDVAEQAHHVGLYTDELYDQMKENPAYVTFQVIEHMDNAVTSRVYKQVGTLKDIGNVADATILKTLVTLRAVEYQKMKRAVFDFLAIHFPQEITDAKTVWTGKGHKPIPPKDETKQRLITYFEKGTLVGKYVDPYIADALENASIGQNLAVVGIFRSLNNAWFRPVFTTLNSGFQIGNFIRDLWRFWKNTPTMTLSRAMRLYVKAMPLARVRAFGLPEEPSARLKNAHADLLDAEQHRVLSVTFNNLQSGRQVEDTQIEDILARSGVGGFQPGQRWGVIKPVMAVLDKIREVGDFIETLPKAAAMYEFTGKGRISDLTAEQRSFIRRKVGSPDFLTRGTASVLNNEIVLFSNAITQAIRSDIEVATEPKTRSGFWWKTATVNLLPKILMAAAMAGLFGETLRRLYQKTTEYDRTNYLIVPVGEDANGNAIYVRVPQDDSGRMIGGLFWKGLTGAIDKDTNITGMIAQVFSYISGQAPGLSPVARAVEDLTEFASGQNPYDEFRGRNVFTDDEWKARDLATLKKFIGYEFQQLGGGVVWKFYAGEARPRVETTGQKILELPIVSNVVGRFLRITTYGETEALNKVKASVERDEARRRTAERTALNEAIRTYQALPADQQTTGRRWATARAVAEQVHADLSKAERVERTAQIVRKLGIGIVRGKADPLTDAVLSATSNDQKVALIQKAAITMGATATQAWLHAAFKEGVVSDDVYTEVVRHRTPAAAAR